MTRRPRSNPATELDRAAQASLNAVAWTPTDDLDLRDWLIQGKKLGVVGRGVAWWIGDWLNYGAKRYGEHYARASRITGYDAQTLMNMAYVASRFKPERRREALSWSHHAELAAVSAAEQDTWLDAAERKRLSVRDLRQQLRTHDAPA